MHLIDSLEFDVALASEERAFAEQEQLQSFMRGSALHVIESVFDQVCSELGARSAGPRTASPPGASGEPRHGPARQPQSQPQPGAAEIWRLDRLEIDLGPVSGPDLCGQWERRLRDQLLEQLRDRLRAPPATAPAAHGGDAVVAKARRRADLDALQHFLLHGCLPWHLTWPAGRSFPAWAQTVVLRDAQAMARQLRQADAGLRQRLTRRLTEQLAPAGLEHLARALGLPALWPLADWVDATVQRAGRTGVAKPAGLLARQLWTAVLDEALQAPACARDARHLRASLRIAAAGRGEPATASTATPPAAFGALSGSGSRSEQEPTAAVLHLRARLRHLWHRRQSQGLDAAVRDSLRSDPAALAAWAAEAGQSTAARHWLAANLPSDTWQRLLGLLAPAAAALYAPLLRRRPLGTAWMQLSRSDWAETRTRLRGAALAAVLLDPPSGAATTAAASGADALRALAQHAAAQLNVEAASIWALWCGPSARRLPVLGVALAAAQGSTALPLGGRGVVLAAYTQPGAANRASVRPARDTLAAAAPAEATPPPLALAVGLEHAALAAELGRALLARDADAAWAAWQAGLAVPGRRVFGSGRVGFTYAGAPSTVLAALCRRASSRQALADCLSTPRQLALVEHASPGARAWLGVWFSPPVWLRLRGQRSASQAWALWWWAWATTPIADAACQHFAAAWLRRAAPRLPAAWADAMPPSPAGRQVQAAIQRWLSGTPLAAQEYRSAARAVELRAAAGIPPVAANRGAGLRVDAIPPAGGAAGLAAAARASAPRRALGDAAEDPTKVDVRDGTEPWADAAAPGPEPAPGACDDGAQPGRGIADSGRLAAWLALSLRTAGARARWVEGLGGRRLLDLVAQVAPAEVPCLQAWTAGSMWPLWSATGADAQGWSPASFWALWWARWAANGAARVDAGADAGAAPGADATNAAGAGFDRAGFVDAWLRHTARRHGLPLSIYLPELAARLKSLQRQQRRPHRQTMARAEAGSPVAAADPAVRDAQAPSLPAAGPPAVPPGSKAGPTHAAVSQHDDPVALVLRRARALATGPGGQRNAAARGESLHAAVPPTTGTQALPATRPGAAGAAARAAAVCTWLMHEQHEQHEQGRLLLAQRPPALKALLEAALSEPAVADELVQRLPTALWPLLLAWLRPAACGSVVAAVAAVGRAAGHPQRWPNAGTDDGPHATQQTPGATPAAPARAKAFPPTPGSGHSPASQARAWRVALQHYFVEGRPHVPGEFERRLAQGDRPAARPALARTEAAALPARRAQSGRPAEPTPFAGLQVGQAAQVNNAGLVLLGAYAPRLFSMLGLTDGRAFVREDAAARAVHLLQWLVDERSDREEHLLVLNKLLCGLPLATPLPREVVLQAHEQDAGRQMLQAVITHWNALGSTSVQGLRETFLQREGRLQRDEGAWRLRVAPRAFDMLLDRLPWGYATLKLPWMTEVLHVDWR